MIRAISEQITLEPSSAELDAISTIFVITNPSFNPFIIMILDPNIKSSVAEYFYRLKRYGSRSAIQESSHSSNKPENAKNSVGGNQTDNPNLKKICV